MPQIDDDLLAPGAVTDPYPLFSAMREHDPVYYSERYRSWFVTRHDDVSAAFRDARFSSDRISGFITDKLSDPDVDPDLRRTFDVLARWMVFKDPPDHTRLRRLVHRAFTPSAVDSIRARVTTIAHGLLDDVVDGGEVDLVEAFAFPLPAIVIAEMLGVPAEDRNRFKVWSDQLASLVFGNFDDPGRYTRATGGMRDLVGYLDGLVSAAEGEPGEDLIGGLVRARDAGDALSHDEVIAMCTLLLFGGHETTTNLIANAMNLLLRHPDQMALLRDGDVPFIDAVEEVVRFDGPAKTVVRQMSEEVELRDRTLHPEDRVFLVPAAANRDPRVFEDPDTFDIVGGGGSHVGFGLGIHYCVGAPLARVEAAESIKALLERLDNPVLATDDLQWQPVLLNRGPKTLPVSFSRTS